MAEAAREEAVPAPLLSGLPDEISIWEILIRLPPKAILRCRAVCPAWRHATSTRDFLLAHHARQPTLPLLNAYNNTGSSVDIIVFDHRAGIDAPDQLQPVARLGCRGTYMTPEASCDGLLIHSCDALINTLSSCSRQFSICNPATHQYAPLPQLHGFSLLGMYRHSPTTEHRLLLRKFRHLTQDNQENQGGSYIFTLGSGQPPRHIGHPEAAQVVYTSSSVLSRGNLHWLIHQLSGDTMIMVFDSTAELFSQMRAPAVARFTHLFEMDDMLGLASFNYARTVIDIWVMQDHESQAWAFKCRIELPLEKMHCENHRILGNVVAVPADGELLVLVNFDGWLHHVDIDGKLVASIRCGSLHTYQFRLKQTLVPHTLFPLLEGYVANDSPFI